METKNLEYVPHGLSRKDTVVVVKALREIEAKHGIITPKAVVEAAKAKNSPLHGFFEWDDKAAANKYRQQQARQLIACVYVRDSDSETSEPVRAFVNIKADAEDNETAQGYVSQGAMLKNPGLQQQIIRYASEQLILWRKKFGGYQEFYQVAKAIDEVVKPGEKAA